MWVKILKMFFKIRALSWYFEPFFVQDEHPSLEDHVKVHAAAERSDHGQVSHAHSYTTKEGTNAMIINGENDTPVAIHKPKSEYKFVSRHFGLFYFSFFFLM